MNNRNTILTLLSLLVFSVFAVGQESSTVIIQDMGYGYTLTAPKGWISSPKSAQEMRLNAAFCPDSTTWVKSKVVMYANVTYKTDDDQTLDDVIKLDIQHFEKDSPGVKSTKSNTLNTFTQRKEVVIYDFSNPSKMNFESVAYIDEGDVVIMIVLGSRDEKIFKANRKDFERLVSSYYCLD